MKHISLLSSCGAVGASAACLKPTWSHEESQKIGVSQKFMGSCNVSSLHSAPSQL